QRTSGLTEVRQVAELEERIARVCRQCAEEVGPQHRRDHRAVAATRLARDAAVRRVVERLVARIHERDYLLAEIRVVIADARRVEELRAAVRGPRVVEDDPRWGTAVVGKQ